MKPGEWVVYRKQKSSTAPGPRARAVSAAPNGDLYTYQVEKYWAVERVLSDGQVRLVTRTGKIHTVPSSDPRLRRATWLERLILGSRFPRHVAGPLEPSDENNAPASG